jgi:hypothetical protein
MNQLDLTMPLARWRNPSSSHAAAAEMMGSEQQRSECGAILALLRTCFAPQTYRSIHALLRGEISEAVEVQRRLNDLRNAGLVRNGAQQRCPISGRLAQTWAAA